MVSRACGLSRVTITKGLRELDDAPLSGGRVRRVGGGRAMLEVSDPTLPDRLEVLLDPATRGDPESPLRWTNKSTRALAAELTGEGHPGGHPVSSVTVAEIMRSMGYSLQGNRKTEEGDDHPDRDASSGSSTRRCGKRYATKRPVISVDTKKKELLGTYENAGRQWRAAKTPHRVQVYSSQVVNAVVLPLHIVALQVLACDAAVVGEARLGFWSRTAGWGSVGLVLACVAALAWSWQG